jgi:polyhydroxyalkanoate synthesis regulator phasin
MQEFIKDIFYLGAGAAFVTKEKLEELKKELVEKGKMTQEEGKQFVDDLLKKSEKSKKDLEKRIQDTVVEQMKKMNVATGDDIADLKKQIRELRKMIEKEQKPED